MRGGVVSTIVTASLAVLVLPLASLAVHNTCVVPRLNRAGAFELIVGVGSH
jgi:hypothetical protein